MKDNPSFEEEIVLDQSSSLPQSREELWGPDCQYDMTYDCPSVVKHVLRCYDIFSDVHDNRTK